MKAFLKSEDLGFEDVQGVVKGAVSAANTYTRHLHPDESLVGLLNFRDAQIEVARHDSGSP